MNIEKLPIIAITMGYAAGIGPELIVKTLADRRNILAIDSSLSGMSKD